MSVITIIWRIVTFSSFISQGYGIDSGLTCDELEERVKEADRRTEIVFPPPIHGRWISQRCEVRTGPEYSLRYELFQESYIFESTTWFYRDETCSHPLYSIAASGRYALRGRSWLTPGATSIDYSPHSIVITPYTQQMADDLCTRVNATCPGQVRRKWRPHHEYIVLNFPIETIITNMDGEMNDASDSWSSCAKSLFKEGALVRVQKRPGDLLPHALRPSTQLLLGDLRTPSGTSSPTTFRPPLVRIEQVDGCEVCRTVSKGSSTSPPTLPLQPKIPPYLGGEWLSVSCEARPLGLFLRRKLRVSGSSWRAEYKFFSDPLCSTSSLTAAAEGYFKPASIPDLRIPGATDFDFMLERAFLTLHDQALVQNMQQDRSCGTPDGWQVGVVRDLTPSKGCTPLGITVPSTEYELVRLEVDALGNTMLLLGQSDPYKRGADGKAIKHRPTTYQPPLLRCSAPELPLTHFLNGFNRGWTLSADFIPMFTCLFGINILNFQRLL